VNGPVQSIADNLDKVVAEDKVILKDILEKADRIAGNVDAITQNGRPEVAKILKDVDLAVRDARDFISTTKGEVTATGSDLRAKLDRLDRSLDALQDTMENAADVSKKVNSPDQGTLGKLVNDPTIADNVEQITDDVKSFTQGLGGLQTIVGLRVDYNLAELLARAYFSVEIYTRPDKFYLIELSSDPRGDIGTTLYVDPTNNLVRSQVVASPGIKWTLQFGRKFESLSFRMGYKDSTGGFGVDFEPWLDDRLKLSLDAFQFTFDQWPRVRLTLAVRFFKYLYVMGGLDDVLNSPREIAVRGTDISGQLPTSYYIGRDPFVGMMIRFTDDDLKSLLLVAGSAITGAASK
jgi:phospholipid/cholesterol/gamma-HCH transport system substrate-binding protein